MAATVSSARGGELPRVSAAAGQLPRSRRGELVQLREGVDVALAYLNTSDRTKIESLTRKAKSWADRYYKGYQYASKPPTVVLNQFPHLFDLNAEAHIRLEANMPVNIGSPEPESGDPRDFRRWERKAIHTEPFPVFSEPTLASEEVLDEVINMPPRRSATPHTKPNTQVDAAMLRESGLLDVLPEFLGQIARANFQADTPLTRTPEAVQLDLEEDAALGQAHAEVEDFNDLLETQKRRHGRRVVLPGGRPFKLPGDKIENNRRETNTSDTEASDVGSSIVVCGASDHFDSGDETDASTSTTASLFANRKRKLDLSQDDSSPAHKIRIQYTPPPIDFRQQYKKMLAEHARNNPGSSSSDELADLEYKIPTPDRSPSVESTPRENFAAPIRVIKIKVPEGWSTPQSSPSGSPVSTSPPKVIVLVDPRSRSPSPPVAPRASASPSRVTKIKVVNSRRTSPVDPLRRSASPSRITNIKVVNSRRTSPAGSPSRSVTPNRITRIKVINKRPSPGPESPFASSPSGSTSSSNIDIARPSSSCSNTSLDSTWSSGSKVTRIKVINKKPSPSPSPQSIASEPIERPSSSCSDGSAKKNTFKIVKRPRVNSATEAEARSSKKLLVDELDMALDGM
ncbi:hypothetical protein B0T21DRAFT_412096 [Apiosordaria backusii]|uniref:Uncharacterized protein n=1 Tax=Apiosordaria backusii TaxID=314023 RepID=A0AA40BJP4_9PEZI|nr:hypothetical protein B0T21DRAFT_412096 [Apiosordaria backusii]